MKQRVINLDNKNVEIYESNGTGIPIFAFHGNSSAANVYNNLLESELGNKHKIIAINFPGHGQSDAAHNPDKDYSIRGLGEMAANIVAYFDYPQYWLLGQSLGGHAIIEALDLFPNIQGLILVSAPPISMSTLEMAFKPDPSEGCLFKSTLDDKEISQFSSCFGKSLQAQDLETLEDNIRKTDPYFRSSLGKSIMRGEVLDELKILSEIDIPVAILGACDDQFLQQSYFENIAIDSLWKKQAIMFEHCGHAISLEKSKAFEKIVTEFINEQSGSSS